MAARIAWDLRLKEHKSTNQPDSDPPNLQHSLDYRLDLDMQLSICDDYDQHREPGFDAV
jgi:hypothetical protein